MSQDKPTERVAEETTTPTKPTPADGQELTDADLSQVSGGWGDPHIETRTAVSEKTFKPTGEFVGH